jgi:hypothetical protein
MIKKEDKKFIKIYLVVGKSKYLIVNLKIKNLINII